MVAYQAPQSMGFSRQEYWCGLPFPSPGDPPDPGIEPGSPALQTDALPSEPPGRSEIKVMAKMHSFVHSVCQVVVEALFWVSFAFGLLELLCFLVIFQNVSFFFYLIYQWLVST